MLAIRHREQLVLGCALTFWLYMVEHRQEVLHLVKTPDDLVETLFDGG